MSFVQNNRPAGRLFKRLFDVLAAGLALFLLSPVLLLAAIGIKLTSPGPVFYRARRVGRDGAIFAMVKLRSMHPGSDRHSAITAVADRRVFALGRFLRRSKIDELPQLWNVLAGEMSLVGPRPEDPKIVRRDYTPWMKETLRVAPGLTSPGSIYGYLHGDDLIDDADPEGSYARKGLPPKLALERAYLERANFLSDLFYLWLTVWALIAQLRGRRPRLPRADTLAARRWAPQGPYFDDPP